MNILLGISWVALLALGLLVLLVYVHARDERILDERRVERERRDENER